MRRLPFHLLLPLALLADLPAQQMRYRDAMFPVDTRRDIVYRWATNRHTLGVETLALDLYQPAGDPASLRAAVVVVHGGGFQVGDKRDAGPERIAMDLASRGFVTVSINYRLAPVGQGAELADVTDATADFRAAVRWLRHNAWWLDIDTDRIGAIGNSAGGIICCQAAYVDDGDDNGDIQAIVELWGYLTDLGALETGEAPVQVVHGTLDPAVPFVLGVLLEQRAEKVGVPAELQPIDGAGHEPWQEYFAGFHEPAVGFLYEHLQLGRLAGLDVVPDRPRPHDATVRAHGVAGDDWVLLLGQRGPDLHLDPWGILRLAPGSLLALRPRPLPPGPGRLVTDTLTLSLPPEISGYTIAWQAVHLRTEDDPRLLTNFVSTGFR